jgi:hypothetical protein
MAREGGWEGQGSGIEKVNSPDIRLAAGFGGERAAGDGCPTLPAGDLICGVPPGDRCWEVAAGGDLIWAGPEPVGIGAYPTK